VRRRTLLKAAAALPLAVVAAAQAAPALAGSTITYANGSYSSSYTAGTNQPWTGWVSSGGAGYQYAYLYSGPSSDSQWLANVPVNQAVSVTAYAPGEVLAPPNPLWYNVIAAQGSGWIYSGLVTEIQPVLLPASAVAPPAGPIPGPIGSGRSIAVSLSRQHLWAYDGATLAWQGDITTGMPDKSTPTGLYSVQKKIPSFKFISPYPVGSPYWYPDSPTHFALQFRADGYYIHDAPWRPYYGPGTDLPHLDPDGTVRAGSHGCVNTKLDTITFLAPWTPLGAAVLIVA